MNADGTAVLREVGDRYHAPAAATRVASIRVLVGVFAGVFLCVRAPYIFDVARLPDGRFEPVGPLSWLGGPLPVGAVQLTVLATFGLAVAFTVGWRYSICGPAFALALVAVTTYDNSWQLIAHTENLFTLHVVVLGFAPAADAWSVDARRRGSTVGAAPRYGRPVRLVSIITVCTYALAGWAKMRNGGLDWITGDVLRNQVAHDNVRKLLLGDHHSPLGAHLVRYGWIFPPLAMASMVVELGAPLALFRGKIRALWVFAAWMFHLGILALMAILFVYPLTGVAFASFGEPDRLWLRWRSRGGPSSNRDDRIIGAAVSGPYGSHGD